MPEPPAVVIPLSVEDCRGRTGTFPLADIGMSFSVSLGASASAVDGSAAAGGGGSITGNSAAINSAKSVSPITLLRWPSSFSALAL